MGLIERWECPNDSGHDVQATAAPVGVERWRCFACGIEAVKVEYVRAEQLRGAVELLDALDGYVGHVNCGVVHGAPECSCGFDDLYTRVRAVVRGQ